MAKPRPAQIYRGDTWLRSWIIKDSTGVPVDLTGASARMHVRNTDDLTLSVSVGTGLTITADAGRVDLRVDAVDTAKFALTTYRFDLEITFADGIVRTIEQGRLIVVEDVTRG